MRPLLYIYARDQGFLKKRNQPVTYKDSEPRHADPFEALRALMEKHERRINDLENEVRLLKEGREYESKG